MPVVSPDRHRLRHHAWWIAGVLLASGCAQRIDARAAAPSAPAGYACSTGAIFSQPIGAPVRQVATLGDTTAVLTGTSASDDVEPSALVGGKVTLTTAGRTPVSSAITPLAGSSVVDLFTLQTEAEHDSTTFGDVDTDGSLCLVRFTAGATPVALIALTLGGVHCCVSVRAFAFDGNAPTDHAFGNYAPYVRQTPTGPVLVSADNAFANAFGSFAASGPAVQVTSWDAAGFTDVTAAHLELVRQDAASYLALYLDPTQPERLGYLAGWVGDECRLGNAATAWSFLARQTDLAASDITRMREFLVAHGYCAP
jgi:hypothetical protein